MAIHLKKERKQNMLLPYMEKDAVEYVCAVKGHHIYTHTKSIDR